MLTFTKAENKFFFYLRKELEAKSKYTFRFFKRKSEKWKEIADEEWRKKSL